MSKNYTYHRKFTDNIFVLGQTGCGKKIFVQNLTRNKKFGKLESVGWISKITLSRNREV